MATHCLFESEDSFTSYSNDVILYVISPQFSIAPAEKSGMAIKSKNQKHNDNKKTIVIR